MNNLDRKFLYKIFLSDEHYSSFFISFDKSLDLLNHEGVYTKCLSNLVFHNFGDCFDSFNKIMKKTKFKFNISKNFILYKINTSDLKSEGFILQEETLEKINRLNKYFKESYGVRFKYKGYGNSSEQETNKQEMAFEFIFDNSENNIYFDKTIESKDIIDRSYLFANIRAKKHFASEIDRLLLDKSDEDSIFKDLYYNKFFITNRLKAVRFYCTKKNLVKVGVCEHTGRELFGYENSDDIIEFSSDEFMIFKNMIKYHNLENYLTNGGFLSSFINMINNDECIVAYGTIEPEFIGFFDSNLSERATEADKEFSKLSHDEKIKLMNIYGLIK
jgi:hypothetical protein